MAHSEIAGLQAVLAIVDEEEVELDLTEEQMAAIQKEWIDKQRLSIGPSQAQIKEARQTIAQEWPIMLAWIVKNSKDEELRDLAARLLVRPFRRPIVRCPWITDRYVRRGQNIPNWLSL